MAKRKMRMGQCRRTKTGRKYCMTPDGVRFVSEGGLSGGKGSGPVGKVCVRFKTVVDKWGNRVRRCAAFAGVGTSGIGNPGKYRVCVRKKRVRSKSGKMVTRCALYRDVTPTRSVR